MKTFRSYSSEETKQFGHDLAESLLGEKHRLAKAATVIALRGDLGAGKTTFTQGFFRGIGIRRNPISPTFVIMRRYETPKSKIPRRFTNVYHFDAYRLKKEEDVEVLEFGRIMADPKNMVLVEWPEKIKGVLPRAHAVGFYPRKERK